MVESHGKRGRDADTQWRGRGLQSIIPEELQDHERIRPQLNAALDMINTASTGQIPQQYIPRPSQGVYGTGAAYGGVPVANGGGGELSLRQLVEKYAVEHNIEFVPKVGRMYNGLQVQLCVTLKLVSILVSYHWS